MSRRPPGFNVTRAAAIVFDTVEPRPSNPNCPAVGLPAGRQIGQAEHEGMARLAGRGGHLHLDRF